MRREKLLFLLIPLTSCGTATCLVGLSEDANGACVFAEPTPCADGQIRAVDGTCTNPSGYEVRDGESLEAPGFGDVPEGPDFDDLPPEDTGDTRPPIDDTGNPPIDTDTGTPVDPVDPCDYTVSIYTAGYPSEIGFMATEDRLGDIPLLVIEPGDMNQSYATLEYDLSIGRRKTVYFFLFDNAADSWNGGWFTVTRNASGNDVVYRETLSAGATTSLEVTLTCQE